MDIKEKNLSYSYQGKETFTTTYSKTPPFGHLGNMVTSLNIYGRSFFGPLVTVLTGFTVHENI